MLAPFDSRAERATIEWCPERGPLDPSRKTAVARCRCARSWQAPGSATRVDHGGREERDHDLVVADERVSASVAGRRPRDDVGLRAIRADEIKIHRRQAGEREAFVAREGDC